MYHTITVGKSASFQWQYVDYESAIYIFKSVSYGVPIAGSIDFKQNISLVKDTNEEYGEIYS